MSKLYVVVVTFNGRKWVDKCIGSLLGSSVPVNVIVIDNCSSDNTARYISKNFLNVDLIESKENIGFGPANNVGFKKAIDNDADYVFLLNQDAWVERDTIKDLVRAHSYDDSYGIISPIHLNGSGDNLDILFHSYVTKQMVNDRELLFNIFNSKNLDRPHDIFFVNAASWLIPIDVLRKVGGFDPLFPHWGEDNNFIDRVKSLHFRVGFCPKAKIYHDREDALSDRKAFSHEYYYRNILRRILDPSQEIGLLSTKKEIRRDILKHLLKLNREKIHELINIYLKLSKNQREILLRDNLYNTPHCFLG